MPTNAADSPPRAWILAPPDGPGVRVWGLTPEQRLRRSLANAGCRAVDRLDPGAAAPAGGGPCLVFRGDLIFDPRLVAGLLSAPDSVVVAPLDGAGDVPVAAHVDAARCAEVAALLCDDAAGAPLPAGLRRVVPDELGPAYMANLRKAEPLHVLRVGPGNVAEVERMLFGAAYKSITDLVTKWAWPAPAAAVTRRLADRGVHPNLVTALSWLLAALAAGLFWQGSFGLGLLVAWSMTFLDTVDGKLARVTLRSSRFGHVFDHSLDLIHPPFWYLAWGLGASGGIDAATAFVVAGYVAGRLLEGLFLLSFQFETHCWRPVDSLFRTITARRNPNLILLSVAAVAGLPGQGMPLVALWTAVSLGFHSVRLGQAWWARWRGTPVTPWDEAPARGARPTPAAAATAGAAGAATAREEAT